MSSASTTHRGGPRERLIFFDCFSTRPSWCWRRAAVAGALLWRLLGLSPCQKVIATADFDNGRRGPVRVVQHLDKVAAERCVLHGGGYQPSLIIAATGAVATAAPPLRRPLGVT